MSGPQVDVLAVLRSEIQRADASAISMGNAARHSLRTGAAKQAQHDNAAKAQTRADAMRAANDVVAELAAAIWEYFGPDDDPSIGWVGRSPSHPDLFQCERCDAEHKDCALIPHTKYCRAVRLIAALAPFKGVQS